MNLIFPIEDNFIVYTEKSEQFLVFNETAKYIWDLWDGRKSPTEIEEQLIEAYRIPREIAQRDVQHFLMFCKKRGILENHPKETLQSTANTPDLTDIHYLKNKCIHTKPYRLFDQFIFIHYSEAWIGEYLERFLSHLESEDSVLEKLRHLYIAYDQQCYYVLNEDSVVGMENTYALAQALLRIQLIFTTYRNSCFTAILHAGAVRWHDTCILVAGKSGSGKSTLIARLIVEDFHYIADDFVPVEDKTMQVLSVPFSHSIKQKSWDVLHPFFPELKKLKTFETSLGKTVKYLPPPDVSYRGLPQKHDVDIIIFPHYNNEGGATSIFRLSSTDAFKLIIEAYSWIETTESSISGFIQWIEKHLVFLFIIPTLKKLFNRSNRYHMKNIKLEKFICSCLAGYDGSLSDEYTHMLQTHTVDWPKVIQIASEHLVLPAFYHILIQYPKVIDSLDDELIEFMHNIYELNAQRNQRIKKQVIFSAKILNSIGIEPVLLKGAAALFMDLYSYPGQRVMADIDILVSPERIDETLAALRKNGYFNEVQPDPAWKTNSIHFPPLFHDRHIATLEIHIHPMGSDYQHIINYNDMLIQSTRIESDSIVYRCPSIAYFLVHHVMHCQLFSNSSPLTYTIPMRRYFEFYILIKKHTKQMDAAFVNRFFKKSGLKNEWLRFLVLFEMCFQVNNTIITINDYQKKKYSIYFKRINWDDFQYRIHLLFMNYYLQINKAKVNMEVRAQLYDKLKNPSWYLAHLKKRIRFFLNGK